MAQDLRSQEIGNPVDVAEVSLVLCAIIGLRHS